MEESQDLGQELVEEIRQGMIYDDAWRPVEGGFQGCFMPIISQADRALEVGGLCLYVFL